MKTAMRLEAPTALLVGLDDHLGAICFGAIDDVAMRIIAVRDASAACARMPETMPSVVVVSADAPSGERSVLQETAMAAGAEIVALPRGGPKAQIIATLAPVLDRALARR